MVPKRRWWCFSLLQVSLHAAVRSSSRGQGGVGAKAEDGGASRCSGPAGAPGTVKAPFHAPACSSSRENGGVVKCGGAPR